MKKILISILLIVLITNCSPPRGRTNSNKYRGTSHIVKRTNAIQDTSAMKNKTTLINYADTTIIEISPEMAKYMTPIEREFNSAYQLFKDGKYEKACPKIRAFKGTLANDDSLWFEAEFIHCECLVYQNKILDAKSNLLGLINNPHVTTIVKQKAIVRLGQIYCYEENYEQAKVFFDLLNKEFPNSKYLKVANCDSIKK